MPPSTSLLAKRHCRMDTQRHPWPPRQPSSKSWGRKVSAQRDGQIICLTPSPEPSSCLPPACDGLVTNYENQSSIDIEKAKRMLDWVRHCQLRPPGCVPISASGVSRWLTGLHWTVADPFRGVHRGDGRLALAAATRQPFVLALACAVACEVLFRKRPVYSAHATIIA